MKKPTATVKKALACIAQLDKQFDNIVADMKKTPMTKAEYDAIERALFSKVEDFKYEMETL